MASRSTPASTWARISLAGPPRPERRMQKLDALAWIFIRRRRITLAWFPGQPALADGRHSFAQLSQGVASGDPRSPGLFSRHFGSRELRRLTTSGGTETGLLPGPLVLVL